MPIGSNGYQDNATLMMAMVEIDLTTTFEQIQVPYHIVQGDRDVITSNKHLTAILEEVDNDHISLEIIPDNAHFPSVETIQKLVGESE